MDADLVEHYAQLVPRRWQALCRTHADAYAGPGHELTLRLFALALLLQEDGIDARPMRQHYLSPAGPLGTPQDAIGIHVGPLQVVGLHGETSWAQIIERDLHDKGLVNDGTDPGATWAADTEEFIPCPHPRETLLAYLADHRARLLTESTTVPHSPPSHPRL